MALVMTGEYRYRDNTACLGMIIEPLNAVTDSSVNDVLTEFLMCCSVAAVYFFIVHSFNIIKLKFSQYFTKSISVYHVHLVS